MKATKKICICEYCKLALLSRGEKFFTAPLYESDDCDIYGDTKACDLCGDECDTSDLYEISFK